MYSDKKGLFEYYWNLLTPPDNGFVLESEYNFDKELGRKHRFDWCFLKQKVAVEVDGGVNMVGGGRHGQDRDREKMNIAAMLGWRVFKFSPAMLTKDPQECVQMVWNSLLYHDMIE